MGPRRRALASHAGSALSGAGLADRRTSADRLGGLYGIAGADIGADGRPRDPLEVVQAFCAGGASVVQLRLKGVDDSTLLRVAEQALQICRDADVALVINDRADICAMVGADGVHVGWDDLPPAAARRVVGPDAWVGVSTHGPAELAEAVAAAPDYVGYGPIWVSPTKTKLGGTRGLGGLSGAVQAAGEVPVVAIGGITSAERVAAVMAAGASGAAVLSAVSGARDMVAAARTLAAAARRL